MVLGSNAYYCQRLDHFIGTTILDFHNRWVDEDKWSVRCLRENWWAPADFDTMEVSWNLPTLFGPSQAKKEIKETKGPRALKVTLVSTISKHQFCSGIRFKLNCSNCLRSAAEEWRGGGWSNTTWVRCNLYSLSVMFMMFIGELHPGSICYNMDHSISILI